MIHKVIGSRPAGNPTFALVSYVFKREKNETAELIGGNMMGYFPSQLSRELQAPMPSKENIKEPTFHAVISLPEGEKLADKQWQEIADEYLKRLGFDTERNPFFLVKHSDTECEHIHIVASKVSISGEYVSLHHDYHKGMAVMRDFEKKFNLQQTAENKKEKTKPHIAEKEIAKRKEKDLTAKEHIQNTIDDFLNKNSVDLQTQNGRDLFEKTLKENGIETKFTINAKGLAGVSFSYDGEAFKGTKLGTAYKANNLIKRGLAAKNTELSAQESFTKDETYFDENRLAQLDKEREQILAAFNELTQEILAPARAQKTAPAVALVSETPTPIPQESEQKIQPEPQELAQEIPPIPQATATESATELLSQEPPAPAQKPAPALDGRKRERIANNAMRETFNYENTERIAEILKNPLNLFEKDEYKGLERSNAIILDFDNAESTPLNKKKISESLENKGIQPSFVGFKDLTAKIFKHVKKILFGILDAVFSKLTAEPSESTPPSAQEIMEIKETTANDLQKSTRFQNASFCRAENLLENLREYFPEKPIIVCATQPNIILDNTCRNLGIVCVDKETDEFKNFENNPVEKYNRAKNKIQAKILARETHKEVMADVAKQLEKQRMQAERQTQIQQTTTHKRRGL